jgi:Flp pilus assembly protein TadG
LSRRDHQRTGERGQALIEFALVAPIMILLLAALVQFGIIFERQIGIENAVREAARRGATQDTTVALANAGTNASWTLAELQTLLANTQTHDATLDVGLQACFFTPSGANATDPAGNHQVWVTVTAGYKHPLFLPLVDLIVDGIDGVSDGRLRATSAATFKVEQEGDNDIGVGACAP